MTESSNSKTSVTVKYAIEIVELFPYPEKIIREPSTDPRRVKCISFDLKRILIRKVRGSHTLSF